MKTHFMTRKQKSREVKGLEELELKQCFFSHDTYAKIEILYIKSDLLWESNIYGMPENLNPHIKTDIEQWDYQSLCKNRILN